jgi:histidinol-phosphate aminotransferase
MSKAFAFAGGRLGYLAADPGLAEILRLVRLPYHLSAPTQAIALAALTHAEAMLGSVEAIKAQRDRIVERLTELELEPVPSDANFVLFGGLADASRTWRDLLDHGVLVRDVGIPHYLRVTAGNPAETDAFLAAMAELAPGARRTPAAQTVPSVPAAHGEERPA